MENIVIDDSFLPKFLGKILCPLLLGELFVITMEIYKTLTTKLEEHLSLNKWTNVSLLQTINFKEKIPIDLLVDFNELNLAVFLWLFPARKKIICLLVFFVLCC